jgi:hypothetical protein
VLRRIASSFLSLWLLTTLMWGGCVSCEQYFMWPGAKSCCAPDGHCKTKAPTQENAGRECKQIAFDHQKSFDLQVDLPVVASVYFLLPPQPVENLSCRLVENPLESSPPDLQALHSTFLI